MKTLLHPTYFPNIPTMAVVTQKKVCWEVHDNYQKQTYRNRCYICTDQGRLMLNIPIKHVGGAQGRQLYRDVKLDNSYPWQRLHWKTLQTAYRASPFFEYFEEDLSPLYSQTHTYLMDFNLGTIEAVCSCLEIDFPLDQTKKYEMEPDNMHDGRFLVNAKIALKADSKPYVQVFHDRHGFIENLSILDLLFNEGPSSTTYLKDFNLEFLNA